MSDRVQRGRRKGLFYPQIFTDILSYLKDNVGASTHEISDETVIAWDTARKYLAELKRRGKVTFRVYGNRKIWWVV